jgi:hypothetical protein
MKKTYILTSLIFRIFYQGYIESGCVSWHARAHLLLWLIHGRYFTEGFKKYLVPVLVLGTF